MPYNWLDWPKYYFIIGFCGKMCGTDFLGCQNLKFKYFYKIMCLITCTCNCCTFVALVFESINIRFKCLVCRKCCNIFSVRMQDKTWIWVRNESTRQIHVQVCIIYRMWKLNYLSKHTVRNSLGNAMKI